MSKTAKNITNSFHSLGKRQLLAATLLLVAALIPAVPPLVDAVTCSSSADCQQQISNLNAQNAQAQSSLNTLAAQAGSYQDAINRLQAQIDSLQGQISANQAQQAALQQQITDAQNKITEQKKFLGEDLKAMYVDGQLSTIEELATSKNLSDYVDKEEYRTSVQNKIDVLIKQIAALQAQLQQQKAQVDVLIKSETDQQNQLASAKAEQDQMLSYNQSQQDSFNQQIQSNKSALSQLYAKQAAIIAASFGGGIHYGGTGNYPYANAVCLNSSGDCSAYSSSPYNWGVNGRPYDEAGWQFRNCTSYAFWRLAQVSGITLTAGSFPTVYRSGGRIGQSLPDFRNLGYAVDHNPEGSIVLAVNTAGNFGHIMYVEAVVNGQAVVSQYNAAGDGRYSTGTLAASGSIWFIHIR